jgi:two-component system, LytTR family, sensor kinase
MLDEIAAELQHTTSEDELLDYACRALAPALSAIRVTWEPLEALPVQPDGASVAVPTTEAPHYLLRVGRLAGGRRLLSGDEAMLARVASSVARRIDTLRLTRERFDRVLREREMQSLATEAELRALRAQINPHFLFNALTTIGYLIQESPGRAVTTLMRLTTLLRGVLKTDGEFTTLRRETELIGCYLDIERERFEERLQVAMVIPEALADMAIPALVVQPLVENAIKHGIAGSRFGGRVTVEARLDGDCLCVSVRNTGAALGERLSASSGGVGLRNVEQRLASYYGQAGTLRLATTNDGATMAEIRMPIADMVGAVALSGKGRGRG